MYIKDMNEALLYDSKIILTKTTIFNEDNAYLSALCELSSTFKTFSCFTILLIQELLEWT